MLHNRFLILLGGCLLLSSAAWADEVGMWIAPIIPTRFKFSQRPERLPTWWRLCHAGALCGPGLWVCLLPDSDEGRKHRLHLLEPDRRRSCCNSRATGRLNSIRVR